MKSDPIFQNFYRYNRVFKVTQFQLVKRLINSLSTQVHNHGSQIMIHSYALEIRLCQVYNHRSQIMIHVYELEIFHSQLTDNGSKIMIGILELEIPLVPLHYHGP